MSLFHRFDVKNASWCFQHPARSPFIARHFEARQQPQGRFVPAAARGSAGNLWQVFQRRAVEPVLFRRELRRRAPQHYSSVCRTTKKGRRFLPGMNAEVSAPKEMGMSRGNPGRAHAVDQSSCTSTLVATDDGGLKCPVCGFVVSPIKLVRTISREERREQIERAELERLKGKYEGEAT